MEEINHTIEGKIEFLHIPSEHFLLNKNRLIRVFIPKIYFRRSKKPYKVIYMFDGQNLFDEATAYFHKEWQIDETVSYYEEIGIRPCIVVGIDYSNDRLSELLPRFSNIAIADLAYKGDNTLNYLVKKVIPVIEKRYNVSKKREDRYLIGSSMGGLMALQGGILYPDVFKNIGAFSPAFPIFRYGLYEQPPAKDCLNNDDAFKYVLDKYTQKDMIDRFKIAMCAGGKGIEKRYYRYVNIFKKEMLNFKWNPSNLFIQVNKKYSHDEYQWAEFFKKAYLFFLK